MTVSNRMGIGYFLNPPSSDTLALSKNSMVVFAVDPRAMVMVPVIIIIIIISTALECFVISLSTISFDAVWHIRPMQLACSMEPRTISFLLGIPIVYT